jgi:hypothetical protein
MAHAFRDQDGVRVPLVWQHGHTDPENVLGHAILQNRDEGMYCEGFFNKTKKADHAHTLLEHGDVTMMSIWANKLIQRDGRVLHGEIREVSLVLAGANPGAKIEHVTLRHGDMDTELEDEAIITTGIPFELSSTENEAVEHDDLDKGVEQTGGTLVHADGDRTVEDVYNEMTDEQKTVLHFMLGEALEAAQGAIQQDNLGDTDDKEGNNDMAGTTRNLFEPKADPTTLVHTMSREDIKGIFADAMRLGSLQDAARDYCVSHGIDDIEILFPDAVAVDKVPEFLQRRTEWVAAFLGGTRKSPFSRIKTLGADLTAEEARAKGYIKGNLKKEEFFGVFKRVTTPTTVYKKQKLDRDDMVDITDFDVVAWLKAEMRVMLDEEIARAALIGDGRDVAHEDKINEQNIRPIAKDHELFTTQVNVNIGDAQSSVQEIIDAVIRSRRFYKGSGLPTMYTTETYIAEFMLLKDTLGRAIYTSLDQVASVLRVSRIVPVEVMEEEEDIIAIIVNPIDYIMGATAGGQVSLFDDFDIDYNQYKYLIETRLCGALIKLKSALCLRKTASGDVLVIPNPPSFNAVAGTVTIIDTTGVTYKDGAGTTIDAGDSPIAVPPGETYTVNATPNSGYFFATSEGDSWTFVNNNS